MNHPLFLIIALLLLSFAITQVFRMVRRNAEEKKRFGGHTSTTAELLGLVSMKLAFASFFYSFLG